MPILPHHEMIVTPRTCIAFNELLPLSPRAEFDTVGVILYISDISESSFRQKTTRMHSLYLTDTSESIIQVQYKLYPGSVLPRSIQVGAMVAISNLSYKSLDTRFNIHLCQKTEYSQFNRNPREPHLRDALSQLNEWLKK